MIKVENITKKFGKFTAVDNLSFEVKEGEVFAFLGPNGAGKTTTIKMLTTVLRPTSGRMALNGFDVSKDSSDVRKSFGIVFQDPSLDNELTAYENLQFHAVLYGMRRSEYADRIDDLLSLVNLADRRNSYVKNFSGGMKRRLEIARGLLHKPKVLFLDEPTLGLDPQTRRLLWDYVKNLNKKEGVTVFMTSHHMDEVEKVAHRIAIIDHGKIIEQGTASDLMKKTGKNTLEDAFIELTGYEVREEEANIGLNQMRINNKLMG